MCNKVYAIIFVVIALILAILASVLPPENIDFVIGISKFFDIMLPVLAVGALLKYIVKGATCCKGCACQTTSSPVVNHLPKE